MLAANPDVAADRRGEPDRAAQAEPDKFTFGSIGRGSLSHLAMASLAMKAGANVVHLPFAGSPAAVTALLRGDVQMAVLPAASVAPLAAEGKLRLLAVTSPKRSPLLPDLPTLRGGRHRRRGGRRLGGPDRPGRHQRAILDRIHKEVARCSRSPRWSASSGPIHAADRQHAGAFRAVLKEEHDRWAPIIAAAASRPNSGLRGISQPLLQNPVSFTVPLPGAWRTELFCIGLPPATVLEVGA